MRFDRPIQCAISARRPREISSMIKVGGSYSTRAPSAARTPWPQYDNELVQCALDVRVLGIRPRAALTMATFRFPGELCAGFWPDFRFDSHDQSGSIKTRDVAHQSVCIDLANPPLNTVS
jgi:hypothetical protein